MVGRLVGQNRMASCASSMLATLLLISGMVYHVAGAGQIAFSHLPPGSLGKVRSSPVRSSLEGRRSPPIRGRKMAEDFSMAERGAGATTSVGGAHFWAETAGGTSAPPGTYRGFCTCQGHFHPPNMFVPRVANLISEGALGRMVLSPWLAC